MPPTRPEPRRPEPRRLALITGASAGIGAAFAEAYAKRGWDLALTARRADRLETLCRSLADHCRIEVMALPDDLADPAAPARLVQAVTERGRSVDALVANAGYGLRGAFADQGPEDQRAFLEVLVASVAALNRAVLPGMRERGYGRIVNVASVMGLIPGSPRGGLYSAAKSFVVSLSEALHLENRSAGVHVTALCPGLTRSEFHAVAGITDEIARAPSWAWMDAADVAAAGLKAVEANRAVCTPGLPNKAVTALAKFLPEGLALALVDRATGR